MLTKLLRWVLPESPFDDNSRCLYCDVRERLAGTRHKPDCVYVAAWKFLEEWEK